MDSSSKVRSVSLYYVICFMNLKGNKQSLSNFKKALSDIERDSANSSIHYDKNKNNNNNNKNMRNLYSSASALDLNTF